MKITESQLKGIIREAMKDSVDYFQEGYADATRYTRPERRYQPEDLDEDSYNDYTDGFEEGLSDREFFGGMISTITGGR